jgi:hypothetical protein
MEPTDLDSPVIVEPVAEPVAAPVVAEPVAATVTPEPAAHGYPSLYDTKATTVVAVLLGMVIIGGIQVVVGRIFNVTRDVHRALTHFVVSMVALVVGAYLTDLIISGPDTSLLAPSEKATILDFIKSTCLMVFAYFFGTKAANTASGE